MHCILDATPREFLANLLALLSIVWVGTHCPWISLLLLRFWKCTSYSPESHICEVSHNLCRPWHHLALDNLRRRVWKIPQRGRLAICTAHSIKITEYTNCIGNICNTKILNIKCCSFGIKCVAVSKSKKISPLSAAQNSLDICTFIVPDSI